MTEYSGMSLGKLNVFDFQIEQQNLKYYYLKIKWNFEV